MEKLGNQLERILNMRMSTPEQPWFDSEPRPRPCADCDEMVHAEPLPRPFGLPQRWWPTKALCFECETEAHKREVAQQREMQTELEKELALESEIARIEAAFKSAKISPRFQGRTFDNFTVRLENEKAFTIASDYAPQEEWLYFYGPCGTGKTHLAAAIANKFIGQIPMLFISCPELLIEIRQSMKSGTENKSYEAAKTVKLLIIDDIGTEKDSEWVKETMFVLINYRYEHHLPTIFTSNCSLDQIADKLSDRVSSRITEMSRVVALIDKDHRLERKN